MCKVIAVANQKGGCSKTSVVANLGIGLALTGKKVLLIDSDPQGSLTASLGFPDPDEIPLHFASLSVHRSGASGQSRRHYSTVLLT
jgi:chromosome partitioning protein